MTQPRNVLARAAAAPGEADARRSARPVRAAGRAPGVTGSSAALPKPLPSGTTARSPRAAVAPHRYTRLLKPAEVTRGKGIVESGTSLTGLAGDPRLTLALASSASLQAPGISSQGGTANLANLEQNRAGIHNLRVKYIYCFFFFFFF